MERKNWTREELILAFNLYLKLPFGKMHHNNPDVINLAKFIGRTTGSIAMRLGNFASLDPLLKQRGIKGLTGGTKQCQPIWDEFYNKSEDLLFESERILAEKENQNIEVKYARILKDVENIKGEDKVREVKTRINQDVFRQIILNEYSTKCAISDINIPELLVASHIIPWSENKEERLNPQNGLCLSSLYDSAFDNYLITINTDYKVLISNKLKKHKSDFDYQIYFGQFENKVISLPERYYPKKEFLEHHNERYSKSQ